MANTQDNSGFLSHLQRLPDVEIPVHLGQFHQRIATFYTLEQVNTGVIRQLTLIFETAPGETWEATKPVLLEPGQELPLTIKHWQHLVRNGRDETVLIEIILEEEPHDVFTREGANLVYTLELTQSEAENGFKKAVPCLDGSIELVVHPFVPYLHDDRPDLDVAMANRIDGSWERVLFKKGLPYPKLGGGLSGRRGDLIVRAVVAPTGDDHPSIKGKEAQNWERILSPGPEYKQRNCS
ncbi:hypothetical protein BT63DRAFT_438684 [Microthyrium microscopicum]|uniref:Chaperone DnaJ C-terminal domain-containing protein n=1 Tax=Microthyrium microscopicum TaxID=703497 RepID=A0A6A6UFX3_9PEZI|nr:hypothetical protein BT63DRAFT_438684 [Microthyrium microscopicum]